MSGYRLIDPPSCILEQKDKTCNHTHTRARAQHLKFAVKERKKRWKRKRIERKKRIMNGQIGEGGRNEGRMSSGWRGEILKKMAGGWREWDSFQFPYLSLFLFVCSSSFVETKLIVQEWKWKKKCMRDSWETISIINIANLTLRKNDEK